MDQTEDHVPPKVKDLVDRFNSFGKLTRHSSIRAKPTPRKNQKDQKNSKIEQVILELICTEAEYISDLKIVVEEYKPYLSSNERSSFLFGNIEEIYEQARNFLEALRKAVRNGEGHEGVARTFHGFKQMLDLYSAYLRNKPKSDFYLEECDGILKRRQKEIVDSIGLSGHLLTPIQRLGRYVLLLESIEKELSKSEISSELLTSAKKEIIFTMRRSNDAILIDTIKNCDIDLSKQGFFLEKEKFLIRKPRKPVVVFLFENIVVLAHNNGAEEFLYFDSIPVYTLSLDPVEKDPLIFKLMDFGNNRVFVLEAATAKIKDKWTSLVRDRLWNEFQKAKEQEILKRSNSTQRRISF